MKKLQYLLVCLSLLFIIASCKKPEGEGGTSSIKGTVWIKQYNATFTVLESEYAAMDEDVYIIYGNNTSYGDKIKTNYNGEYEFKYLREGNYKIYVYSKDNTLQSASGKIAVVKEVKITDSDQTKNVDQITIYK